MHGAGRIGAAYIGSCWLTSAVKFLTNSKAEKFSLNNRIAFTFPSDVRGFLECRSSLAASMPGSPRASPTSLEDGVKENEKEKKRLQKAFRNIKREEKGEN